MTIEQQTPFPQQPAAVPSAVKPGPQGIGGWLILPLLGFIGTIALTGWNLVQAFAAWDGLVAIFTTDRFAGARVPISLSLVGGTLVIASAAYCLYLMFAKKHALVTFATLHYLILAAVGVIDLVGTGAIERAIPDMQSDPTAWRDAARGIVAACIWVPYFRLSKRVRNTFTA